MAAWQLRHAIPAPDCDMTTTAFMSVTTAFMSVKRYRPVWLSRHRHAATASGSIFVLPPPLPLVAGCVVLLLVKGTDRYRKFVLTFRPRSLD
jgi:hypothetical protein